MRELTLEELERLAREREATYNKRLRQNYHLARRLGFSTTEARILSFRSQETILKLAEEKKARVVANE